MTRAITVALLVVVVLAAVWSGLWAYAAHTARTMVADFVQGGQRTGWDVSYESLETSGYPFAVHLEATGVRAASVGGNGVTWRGHAPVVRARVVPWRLQRLEVRAGSETTLHVTDKGRGFAVRATVEALVAAVDVGLEAWAADAQAEGLIARLDTGETMTIAALVASGRRLHAPEAENPSLKLMMSARTIHLPLEMTRSVAETVDRVVIETAVLGPLTGFSPAALMQWRDRDGVLRIERFLVAAGAVQVRADGNARLDPQLQPQAALSARIHGIGTVLDTLVGGGVIGARTARMAQSVLSLMSRAPADGGPPEVVVPLRLRQGTVSLGPVPLFQIGPIDWGGGS